MHQPSSRWAHRSVYRRRGSPRSSQGSSTHEDGRPRRRSPLINSSLRFDSSIDGPLVTTGFQITETLTSLRISSEHLIPLRFLVVVSPRVRSLRSSPSSLSFIYPISPLHNVNPIKTYPPFLITTADRELALLSLRASRLRADLARLPSNQTTTESFQLTASSEYPLSCAPQG